MRLGIVILFLYVAWLSYAVNVLEDGLDDVDHELGEVIEIMQVVTHEVGRLRGYHE